jgi:hypothetical protein
MLCNLQEGIESGLGSWFEDNCRKVVGNGNFTYFWLDNWIGGVPLCYKFNRLFNLAVNKECSVEEMSRLGWGEGVNAWRWKRQLMAWEEDSVRE